MSGLERLLPNRDLRSSEVAARLSPQLGTVMHRGCFQRWTRMPIVDETELRSLLAERKITILSVDTNIFDEKQWQFNSPPLETLSSLRRSWFSFVLSGTVYREVLGHIEKGTEEAFRSASKGIGHALFAFETEDPTRDALMERITQGRSSAQAARERLESFVDKTGCEVLNDSSIVDTSVLFDGYFSGSPPFAKKKNEFPDALALHALTRAAANRETRILVVSKDGDWRAFCEQADDLYLVPELEMALDLVNNASDALRGTVFSWMAAGGNGHDAIRDHLIELVESIEFSANGTPTSGEVEIMPWGGEIKAVEWPTSEEVDIINIEPLGESGSLGVTVSLPVTVTVDVSIELAFSVWDSVDRESVSMGGRSIEAEDIFDARMTVSLEVAGDGSEGGVALYGGAELDVRHHEIELGDLDIFDDEDRDID